MYEEDLYTLKINCKGKRTVGKANKRNKCRKNIIGFKKVKIKIIQKSKENKMEEERKKGKKKKIP